jgi:cytochrome c oxidase assembly protein subunit 15
VVLDRWLGQNLALVHGCFAQLVFGLTMVLAVVTSRGWLAAFDAGTTPVAGLALRQATLVLVGLVYLQIVFGAVLRHTYAAIGPRGHLLIAFAVVGGTAWVVKEVWEHHRGERALWRPAHMLAMLVCLQLLFGVEAWMMRYSAAGLGHQIGVRTVHVLLGSLIFAAVIVTALQARRGIVMAAPVEKPHGESSSREVVASVEQHPVEVA